jgi:hypothetical protein
MPEPVKKTEPKKLTIHQHLVRIQQELKAPKNQYNSFGKYKYRSCEDILEGLKPLLKGYDLAITIKDEVQMVGDRYYIYATASISDNEGHFLSNSAYAREEESKKGMDGSQVTGAASSYARKYALNGLLAIDDTKDSDRTSEAKQVLEIDRKIIDLIEKAPDLPTLTKICHDASEGKSPEYKKAVLIHYNNRKSQLGGGL